MIDLHCHILPGVDDGPDSLEESLEYVGADEYVEVTPESIRLRKILLAEHERKREKNA